MDRDDASPGHLSAGLAAPTARLAVAADLAALRALYRDLNPDTAALPDDRARAI